jgi:hypothetical protein
MAWGSDSPQEEAGGGERGRGVQLALHSPEVKATLAAPTWFFPSNSVGAFRSFSSLNLPKEELDRYMRSTSMFAHLARFTATRPLPALHRDTRASLTAGKLSEVIFRIDRRPQRLDQRVVAATGVVAVPSPPLPLLCTGCVREPPTERDAWVDVGGRGLLHLATQAQG